MAQVLSLLVVAVLLIVVMTIIMNIIGIINISDNNCFILVLSFLIGPWKELLL